MKWHRIIILLFIAWAGVMYYRYHSIAKLFMDGSQGNTEDGNASPNRRSSSFYGGVGNVGGIGKVGNNSFPSHH